MEHSKWIYWIGTNKKKGMICKNCINANVCKIKKEFEEKEVDGVYIERCEYFKDRNKEEAEKALKERENNEKS